jgi:putative transcriptional regulator
MSRAGKRLIEAAKEVAAIARGDREPASTHVPLEIDVGSIRRKLKLSQEDFASQFGFTVNQIRDWEQGRSRPVGGVRAYLMIIDRSPGRVRVLLNELRRAA